MRLSVWLHGGKSLLGDLPASLLFQAFHTLLCQTALPCRYFEMVKDINELEQQMQKLTDDDLKAKTAEFKQRLSNGVSLDELLVEAFAVVREVSSRVLRLRHFDAQLVSL